MKNVARDQLLQKQMSCLFRVGFPVVYPEEIYLIRSKKGPATGQVVCRACIVEMSDSTDMTVLFALQCIPEFSSTFVCF